MAAPDETTEDLDASEETRIAFFSYAPLPTDHPTPLVDLPAEARARLEGR